MTIFDNFPEEPYTYLSITRGGVKGNTITSERVLSGIFKLRSSSTSQANMENRASTATLHTHPEDFECANIADLVGQGIMKDGVCYEITSVTGGKNFANGIMEHLTFTLDRAEFVEED